MEAEKFVPKQWEVVVVEVIPNCYFCEDGTPGPYDFATKMGPWANGCETHWKMHRANLGLGVGKGQLWITPDQVACSKCGGTLFPDDDPQSKHRICMDCGAVNRRTRSRKP